MPISKKSSLQNEMTALPIVRIDAMDLSMAIPLREYFVTNGCAVSINTDQKEHVFYHIVIGDAKYVKSFLGDTHIQSNKSLYICWTLAQENDFAVFLDTDQKLAYIDPKQITQTELNGLLNFFFTGHTKTKNFQTVTRSQLPTGKEQIVQEPYKRPKQRETTTYHDTSIQDKARITKTIEKEFPMTIRTEPKKHTVTKRYLALKTFGLLIVFCFFVLITFFGVMSATCFAVYRGVRCVKSEQTTCVTNWSAVAEHSLAASENLFVYIDAPRKLLQTVMNRPITISTYDRLFTILHRIISIEKQATALMSDSQLFLSAFFPVTTQDSDTTTVVQMEAIKTRLFSLQSDVDMTHVMIQDLLASHTFPFTLRQSKDIIRHADTTLNQIRDSISTIQRISLLYPYISGFKDRQTYIILLQNSMELRPTGGFIGSFMKLSISDGRIDDMNVQDIYAIDGQLKGHVDPPEPIATLLNQEHWYLRDSNWNPDFPQSAQKALWFYEKETGETPQGIIAVDSSIIMDILRITGPIKLSDFNDEITADNFYAKSMYYTQTNFFPGSTQKKDFLGSLLSEMMTRIFGENSIAKMRLFELLEQALEQRDMQFYFTSQEAQQIVEQFHWAGVIPTKRLCSDPHPDTTICIPDYSAIFESNMGVNKANYFIKRTQSRDITINDRGEISETIIRTLTNTSQGETGSGTYRNYMRILIPKAAHVTAFSINDVPVPASTHKKGMMVEMPYGEIDEETFVDYIAFAVAFDVAPGTSTTIKITYTQPAIGNAALTRPPTVELYDQKQSGVSDVPMRIRVHFPSIWTVKEDTTTVTPSLANDGYLEYNSTMSHDIDLEIPFIQKGISL